MAPGVKTVYMPATKRDLDKNGRVKDRLIDICRHGAQKDHVRVVITKTRPSRNPHMPDEQVPVIEISQGGDVAEFGVSRLTQSMADLFPAEWRTAINNRRRERATKKAARRAKFAPKAVKK